MALATIVMAAAPLRRPLTAAIGRGAASTKYAALSSLRNVPVSYMTAVDGCLHDRFGTGWMLQTDALSAILFVVVALFVLHKINADSAQGLAAG